MATTSDDSTRTASAIEPVRLTTMLGNALLTLAGVKTLYVGYPVAGAEAGQLAYITSIYTDVDGVKKPLEIPIVIDEVGKNAPRAKMSADELKAAGYRSDEGIARRVAAAPDYFDRMVAAARTHDVLGDDDMMRSFINTAPASRVSYHVATPQEVTALGGSLEHEVRNLERASRLLRLAIRDEKPSVVDALTFAREALRVDARAISDAKLRTIQSFETAAEAEQLRSPS